jgi:hypothetical protein
MAELAFTKLADTMPVRGLWEGGKSATMGRTGKMERAKGIEPSCAVWKTAVLPLNYARTGAGNHNVRAGVVNAAGDKNPKTEGRNPKEDINMKTGISDRVWSLEEIAALILTVDSFGGKVQLFAVIRSHTMRKAATWYLLALVVLNVLLAFGTASLIEMLEHALPAGSYAIPGFTMFVIEYHWWPYLFVLLASVLAWISIFSRWQSAVFYHFIFVCLIIEGSILFASQIAFILPLHLLQNH